jgi:hypothetical protein
MSQPGSPAPILAAAQAEPLPELSQMCDTVASLDVLQRSAPARSRYGADRVTFFVNQTLPERIASRRTLPLRQAPPPRATRLSRCKVSFPLPFPNSTSVPSPPTLR